MAQIEPLRALHYNLEKTGGLQEVVAPPYDVIDAGQRAELEERSLYNVVRIDLPQGPDPYGAAARTLTRWRDEEVIVQDREPALWALEQDYTGPDGQRRTRRGFLARVRVEPYGAGRIRPHERTHPGPKEDRLRLTRATKANLSPIFSLFSDPANAARSAFEPTTVGAPWGETVDEDGTRNRLWRVADQEAIGAVKRALEDNELLIADGHHRYETARIYADELDRHGADELDRHGAGEFDRHGAGELDRDREHRYVLMDLVALQDPGLTVFPTHRLLKNLTDDQQEALAAAIRRDFEMEELSSTNQLAPDGEPGKIVLGYLDSAARRPFRLTLKNPAIADAALADRAEPYRRLDTAVLEALILKGALEMTDEDIDHLTQLGYARDTRQAIALVETRQYDAAFLMAPPPIELIQAVAAAGESMPPKSTYFFPKVPTGLLFNPLA